MAENNTLTQTTVLEVDTVKAIKSVQDLKDNIKTLRGVMNDATIGSEEYTAAQAELAAQQNALREVQKGSAASIEEITKAAAGLGTSYVSLVNQMAKLRAEYRTTEDEMKRNRLAAEIKNINDKLKEMDASRGVFSRNVGDYANQMAKGFQATAGAASSAVNPLKNVNSGLTAISTTPVIAILGILVNILDRLVKTFKSNEETMNAFRRAMAPVDAVMTKFKNSIQEAAAVLVKLIDWTMKAATAVGKFLKVISEEDEKAAKAHEGIINDEIALTEKRRKYEVENAESAARISELRAKAAEKDKYTAQQRLEFLKGAQAEEEKIADRSLVLAQDEYDLLKRKAELAGNSAEENEELNRSYIKLIETKTAYNNKTRELNTQIAEATKQMNAEAKAAEDAAEKIRALADLSLDIDVSGLDEVEKINDKIVLPEDQWGERAKLMQEYIDREADMQIKKNRLLIEDEQIRADEEFRIRMEAEERKLAVLREAEEKTIDPFTKLDLQRQIADMEVDIEIAKNDRISELARKSAEEREVMFKASLQGMFDVASGAFDLLNDIAENMEVTNEKEFKRQQNLQVAAATINMITGAVGAFMQAMSSYPAPVGPIVGAAMSALALTTGAVQIRKIKQQKYNGDSSSAPSTSSASISVSPPNIETQLPTVRTLTGAKEEERLNRMASPVRAYIVDSDLQAKERERDVIEEETSF